MANPDAERRLRIDLAACYRLMALFKWDDLVFTHISARLPGPEHHFLSNPYAREDVTCVMHTHSLNGVAVAAQQEGLLPLSQQSLLVLGSLGYHDYEGVAVNPDEKPRLVADLGSKNALILRNHGLLTVGRTVADAFVAMYFLEAACTIQVRAQAGAALRPIGRPILDGIRAQAATATRGMSMDQLVWPGLLRRLDRQMPGYAE